MEVMDGPITKNGYECKHYTAEVTKRQEKNGFNNCKQRIKMLKISLGALNDDYEHKLINTQVMILR